MTSPPYWALRDYGTASWEGGDENCDHKEAKEKSRHDYDLSKAQTTTHRGAKKGTDQAKWKDKCPNCGAIKIDKQIGLEPTFEKYISDLCDIFDEVKRVLRKDGTCWINLGDTYFKDKMLAMIPFRFAIEMVDGIDKPNLIKEETDRSWLAGIIDGEGCIGISRSYPKDKSQYYSPYLRVKMNDREVIENIVRITKSGKVIKEKDYSKDGIKRKQQYGWRVDGKMACKIISDCYKYLIAKRNQTKIACYLGDKQEKNNKMGKFLSEEELKEREYLFELIKKYNQREIKGDCELPSPPQSRRGGGWILRNTIIWHKPNCMPQSVKDRFTVDYEYLFFFSKSTKYYFETQYEQFISNEYDLARMAKARTEFGGKWAQNSGGAIKTQRAFVAGNKEGRNKRAVWSICPKPFKGAHFALYPEELCETPIKAGCPEGGTVLDPFFGAGTTGLVALKQNKKFIGIELNPEYIEIAKKRLKPFLEQEKLE